jgi:hypothetical protein
MDATPFEQEDVVAEATYFTDPVTVEPLAGLVTVTPANAAGAQDKNRHTMSLGHLNITYFSNLFYLLPNCLNNGPAMQQPWRAEDAGGSGSCRRCSYNERIRFPAMFLGIDP